MMSRTFGNEPWQLCARRLLKWQGSLTRWRRWMRSKPVSRVRVLVTRVLFGPGKPHGVALALMVRVKRPDTKVVFVARAETEPHTEGLGVFLPRLNPYILVATVCRLLSSPGDDSAEAFVRE